MPLRLATLQRLREWIYAGGTLVTFAGATTWLTDEKVNLLPSKRERREKAVLSRQAARCELREQQNRPGERDEARASNQPAQTQPQDATATGPPKDRAQAALIGLSNRREEWPSATPGALLRVTVDSQHWLGFGYGETTTVHGGQQSHLHAAASSIKV